MGTKNLAEYQMPSFQLICSGLEFKLNGHSIVCTFLSFVHGGLSQHNLLASVTQQVVVGFFFPAPGDYVSWFIQCK